MRVLVTGVQTFALPVYIVGTYGWFDYRELQGAINIPIIANHVALRVAGQVRRQDGRTENLNGGPDFDNVHQDSIRASLLVEPTDTIKSTTIFDYFRADERAGGRSEEHTSELQSLMRRSYAVLCLK